MHTDDQLLAFNNQIAGKAVKWWEVHSSAMGHDQDELFLQLSDGSVVRIFAEPRQFGAALRIEAHARLPIGRPVRNLPEEANRQ